MFSQYSIVTLIPTFKSIKNSATESPTTSSTLPAGAGKAGFTLEKGLAAFTTMRLPVVANAFDKTRALVTVIVKLSRILLQASGAHARHIGTFLGAILIVWPP